MVAEAKRLAKAREDGRTSVCERLVKWQVSERGPGWIRLEGTAWAYDATLVDDDPVLTGVEHADPKAANVNIPVRGDHK